MTGEVPQRPTSDDDSEGWKAYWAAEGMPWRTEPEVDEERQQYLAQRRAVMPNIKKGIYPFRDENGSIRLTRADVEWLLATHESGGISGPVHWKDEKQRGREGLDVRGADLSNADLQGLPLARLVGGLTLDQGMNATLEQREAAAVHLEKTKLAMSNLEAALLGKVPLEGAVLISASLEGADLYNAHLSSTLLTGAHLEQASLFRAHLEGSFLVGVHLDGANLREATLDSGTALNGISLGTKRHGFTSVADVRWDGSNLAVVRWSQVSMLGDEVTARQKITLNGTRKNVAMRLEEFDRAVRAYRQLAAALRSQGLNEDADRFAYRAQMLQRQVLRRQRAVGRWAFSWFLAIIGGYGYRPLRSIVTYVATIGIFAVLYWCVTNNISLTHGLFTHIIVWMGMSPPSTSSQPLQGYEAVVVSMTSFHGRGFFQPVQSPGDKVAILAAIEAAVGLLIEITFIATFTQRFFAR